MIIPGIEKCQLSCRQDRAAYRAAPNWDEIDVQIDNGCTIGRASYYASPLHDVSR